LKSLLAPRPIRFVLVGALNTLSGLLVIYSLKWLFGVHDLPANLMGYVVGLCISYVLNERWTFAFRGSRLAAVPRFLVVIVVAYLANLATVSAALYWGAVDSYVAQALGVAPYALVSYFGFKKFAFAASGMRSGSRAA
jgi:putative flippase GtrA